MAEPITVAVGTLVAIGSAIGGYLANPRKKKNGVCPLHSGIDSRLKTGDGDIKEIKGILQNHGEILARLDERTEHLKVR